MITPQQVILLGTCTRTHGKRGEVQVVADRDLLSPETNVQFVLFELDNILTPFRLVDWREKGADAYLFSLAGVDTEERALRLCGKRVFLLRSDLTDDPEDELLTWDDLIGYEVTDASLGRLGVVTEVDDSTINTLLLLDNGTIIPAHEDLIEEIDSEKKKLLVNLPDGLV